MAASRSSGGEDRPSAPILKGIDAREREILDDDIAGLMAGGETGNEGNRSEEPQKAS
jgi:hypothetical protein